MDGVIGFQVLDVQSLEPEQCVLMGDKVQQDVVSMVVEGCMYKMPFFDDQMCTLQKVGGVDSKGRRVL